MGELRPVLKDAPITAGFYPDPLLDRLREECVGGPLFDDESNVAVVRADELRVMLQQQAWLKEFARWVLNEQPPDDQLGLPSPS